MIRLQSQFDMATESFHAEKNGVRFFIALQDPSRDALREALLLSETSKRNVRWRWMMSEMHRR